MTAALCNALTLLGLYCFEHVLPWGSISGGGLYFLNMFYPGALLVGGGGALIVGLY